LQLFESWAEGLTPAQFKQVVIEPTRKLVARLRELGVSEPIIGFPRGSGAQLSAYAHETGVTALGIDTQTPAAFAINAAPKNMPLQGNLDPQTLIVGGEALDRAARDVVAAFKGAPHIFNLGHGITPEATPENLARLVQVVKGGV
jgi:uroporphyrinogen decarboxylase